MGKELLKLVKIFDDFIEAYTLEFKFKVWKIFLIVIMVLMMGRLTVVREPYYVYKDMPDRCQLIIENYHGAGVERHMIPMSRGCFLIKKFHKELGIIQNETLTDKFGLTNEIFTLRKSSIVTAPDPIRPVYQGIVGDVFWGGSNYYLHDDESLYEYYPNGTATGNIEPYYGLKTDNRPVYQDVTDFTSTIEFEDYLNSTGYKLKLDNIALMISNGSYSPLPDNCDLMSSIFGSDLREQLWFCYEFGEDIDPLISIYYRPVGVES